MPDQEAQTTTVTLKLDADSVEAVALRVAELLAEAEVERYIGDQRVRVDSLADQPRLPTRITMAKRTVTLNGKPVDPSWVLVLRAGKEPHFNYPSGQRAYTIGAADEVVATQELEHMSVSDFE